MRQSGPFKFSLEKVHLFLACNASPRKSAKTDIRATNKAEQTQLLERFTTASSAYTN